MVIDEVKRKSAPWVAAGFCAALSAMTIVTDLSLSFINHTNSNLPIVFLCFLPMCFFFVGAAVSDMRNQIRELREQVATLKQTNS